MKKVTLQFTSLQLLAECMFTLGLTKAEINYDSYTLTAELSQKQVEQSKEYTVSVFEVELATSSL